MTNDDVSSPISAPKAQVPFLKWAGGKRWFASRYLHMVPKFYGRYIEPFLGSGAMYFALRPARAILSDLNQDLIECYSAVRAKPTAIAKLLAMHNDRHSENYYYEMRGRKFLDRAEKAAQFIYLNRTCWNGLYRVNKQNNFNVPIGTKTNVVLSTDDFCAMGKILRGAEIKHQDFQSSIDAAKEGDFIFVDPPYTVKHNLNGFLKYNDKIFSWSDQIRLRDAILRASRRGVMVLATNANHSSVRELYEGVGIQEVVDRASVLASSSKHRARTQELTIRTWESDS